MLQKFNYLSPPISVRYHNNKNKIKILDFSYNSELEMPFFFNNSKFLFFKATVLSEHPLGALYIKTTFRESPCNARALGGDINGEKGDGKQG